MDKLIQSKLENINKSSKTKNEKCFMVSLLYLEESSKCLHTMRMKKSEKEIETCKENLLNNFRNFMDLCWK